MTKQKFLFDDWILGFIGLLFLACLPVGGVIGD